jgi:high affinity sulfate transporter 1
MKTVSKPTEDPAKPTGITKWMPGVAMLRSYQREWLPKDILAGLVLSALLVPQGMAYAELAGLPAITGLYTTVLCLVAYALFGPSRYLVLGPDSSLGPMIAAAILPLAAGSESQAIALAGMLSILVGLLCVTAGVAKLGFVADLLSRPVRVGYMAGLAVTIVVGQLPKLFGFSVDASGLFAELAAFWQNLDSTNVWALAIGVVDLILILILKRRRSRIPGVLAAVIVSIVSVSLLDLTAQGVKVVGTLPQGFPRPSLPVIEWSTLPVLLATAFGISLVAIGDTISTSVGFAARRGYKVDSNQELIGIGSANLLASMFQGFPVSTSGSRTAVAEQSGAKSQLTGLVAAGAVLAMLVFVPGLMRNLSQSALAAIVIMAAVSLFDVKQLRTLFAMRRTEFAMALICASGVAIFGVLEGIVLALVVSVMQFFARFWRPYSTVLGKPEGVSGYHDITRYPDAELIPGLLMLRWDAPIFFANTNLFREMVQERIAESAVKPHWVLIAAYSITDVDTTAAEMLTDLDNELNADDVHLVFAGLKDPVRDRIIQYGLLETIKKKHFFPTVEAAVQSFKDRHLDSDSSSEQS